MDNLDEDTIENLAVKYGDILGAESDDLGVIDYKERIREAVESGKFRVTININDLRSRNAELIPG